MYIYKIMACVSTLCHLTGLHKLCCRLGKRSFFRTRRCAKTPGCRVFGPDLGDAVSGSGKIAGVVMLLMLLLLMMMKKMQPQPSEGACAERMYDSTCTIQLPFLVNWRHSTRMVHFHRRCLSKSPRAFRLTFPPQFSTRSPPFVQRSTYLDCDFLQSYLRWTSPDSDWLEEAFVLGSSGNWNIWGVPWPWRYPHSWVV